MRRPQALRTLAAVAFCCGLLAVLLRLGWIGDDAWISLRTVENLAHGHGPVWNVAERVQTYTHPLWLLLLLLVRLLTQEAYFGTIALSLLLSIVAALLLLRMARTTAAAATIALLLLLSRSFTDYAVSGLENPLTFLLLVLFAQTASGAAALPARTGRIALLASLLALTRLDLGLLCAPVLLGNLRGQRPAPWLARTAAGMAPLLLWLAFAAFYYGSPFPITAFAKATHVGIPALDLVQQGLHYVVYVATTDPLTLAAIAAGIALGLGRAELQCRLPALGALLYCGYVVKVGGDFMAGRFFTPPFVVAAAILARAAAQAPPRHLLAAMAAALVVALLPGPPAWMHGPAGDRLPTEAYRGIVDERCFYYETLGLLAPQRSIPVPGAVSAGLRQLGRTTPVIATFGRVGRYAYEGGELVHVVDPWLLDPLLMRLPVEDPRRWRIGHFVRAVPEGYLETLATGENRIRHAGLARYYDALRLVVRTDVPLFAGARLHALWQLWTGALDGGLADYAAGDYRNPPLTVVPAAELEQELPPSALGTGPLWFDDPRARIVYRGGIEVRLPEPVATGRLQLQLAGGDFLVYRLRLLRRGTQVAGLRVDARVLPTVAGLGPFTIDLPAGADPFDAVHVDVPDAPSYETAVLGSLRVMP